MDTDSSFSSGYKLGGALEFNDPTYVKRNADNQLYNSLKQREFCYVFNSRQTGKSSLKVQIFHQLRQEGIACADIDLTIIIDAGTTSENFYNGFIVQLIDTLDKSVVKLDFDRQVWWQKHDDLSHVHRLEIFMRQVILKQISQHLVIFVDEIDSILDLDFRSSFFALIRSFDNNRSIQSDYKRLTFVLLGVATPSDLIQDKSATPFNIGQAIALKGFTASEVGPLMTGLEGKVDNPSEVMIQILSWTGGQPFLTQRLCDLIVKDSRRITIGMESETVKQIVKSRIIDVWETNDSQQHFNAIKNRIFKADSQNFVISLLEMYKEILIKGEIRVTNNSSEQGELKLSGLVISEEGHLRPFNRIYQEVFNLEWINDKLAELRPYKDQLDSWCNAKEEIKERYLLYGKDLDDSLKWAEDKTLGKIDRLFLDASRDFQKNIEANFPEGDYQSFGYAMLIWTGGVKSLNQFIFSHISTQHKSIVNPKLIKTVVDLEQWFDAKFKLFDKLKKFKEDESIRNKFEEIIHDLLNTSECNLISLLLKYQEILEKKEVDFDENSLEHKTLINMCLVILDKDNKLRIINKIYKKLLNQDWIKEVMEKLCPYKKAFRDWKSLASDSRCQKRAYLLKNNDLKLALEWLGKKPTPKLEISEIEFVMTSLVSEVWTTASSSVQSEAISLIITFRPSLQEKNNYSDFLLQEILEWTRPEPLLLNELLEEVNKTEIVTTNYHNWIEQLVKTQIINKWQNSKLAKHFRLIEQGLTNNQSCESFWLIAKYRQILLQGKIEFDETKKNTKLIELGLVVKIDQQLEIANPIYQNIFSQRWTYQKLSEYKRIRAINLLKWCLISDPEKKDPAQHSYLDEWINNNLPVVQKIVQDAQGEILDNEFNFIDEIKLLTYDILKMGFVEDSQIQFCLNRTFNKEIKKMEQDNFDKLLSAIVEEGSAIEAIAIVNLGKEGGIVYHNKELETSKPEIYQALFRQRDASEALAYFADLKGIPAALKTFGAATKYGALEYSMFYLDKGIVLVDFLDLPELTVAICFIATTEANFTKLVYQYRKRINELKSELEKTLLNL
jgi:hypothetical protein